MGNVRWKVDRLTLFEVDDLAAALLDARNSFFDEQQLWPDVDMPDPSNRSRSVDTSFIGRRVAMPVMTPPGSIPALGIRSPPAGA
jgi:hypothetical protein